MSEPEKPPSPQARPRRFAFFRRTLPLLLLLAGALWYFRDAPRDVTLAMDLAGRRDGLKALRLDLYQLPERARARHVELYYSESAPPAPQLRAPVRLTPGEYEAVVTFDYGARAETLERRFTLERQDEVVLPP
ncbi:MAG: hypothetical protein QM765_06570 [Myxococcales bacterium]